MTLKIASWNLNWNWGNWNVIPNKNKLKVAEYLLNIYKFDVLALLEADADVNCHPEIEGYTKVFRGRNTDTKYNWNGILLYVRKTIRYSVCTPVIQELDTMNSSCFLPIQIEIGAVILNNMFVWTLKKNGEKGYYGYNRVNELISSKYVKQLPNTRRFLHGSYGHVIFMGDFNIYLKADIREETKERLGIWQEFMKMTSFNSLVKKQNPKATYLSKRNRFKELGSNDHCFVSRHLDMYTTLHVGENSYNGVVSDHRLICLELNT